MVVLINVKIFDDIEPYIWKIFSRVRILSSTTVDIYREFFEPFNCILPAMIIVYI
jgi:hypothetical protein